MKFYFTYGSENQPFYGGWTEIEAPDRDTAVEVFRMFHPDRTDGLLNCCSVYSQADFNRTCMAGPRGNFGYFCHERICLTREIPERSNR